MLVNRKTGGGEIMKEYKEERREIQKCKVSEVNRKAAISVENY